MSRQRKVDGTRNATRAIMDRSPWQVLLVEDSASDAFAFQRALSSCATTARFNWAQSLEAARALIGQRSIDAVFLDLQLPDGHGLELLDWLKRDPIFAAMPVIVLTASVGEADRLAAEALGADHFFVKPFDFDALVALVREVARFHPPPAPKCG